MIILVNRLVQQSTILVLCPGIITQFLNQIQRVLGYIEFPTLHPLQLKLELVGLDRGILVAWYYIESGILDVGNGLRLGTVRIYLNPPSNTIILQGLDDVLVLHMSSVAPLPDIEYLFP